MRLFGEIGGATLEGAGSKHWWAWLSKISKSILNAWNLLLRDGFCMCSKFFCTLRHTARLRAYVIYDAIIYSKRRLLRLRPLPSNNELSAAKAHWKKLVLT